MAELAVVTGRLQANTFFDVCSEALFFIIAEETVTLEVSFDEYYKKLTFQCGFNLSCLGKVQETGFEYFAQDDFRCRKPDVKIEVRWGKWCLRSKLNG